MDNKPNTIEGRLHVKDRHLKESWAKKLGVNYGCGWCSEIWKGKQLLGYIHDRHECGEVVYAATAIDKIATADGFTARVPINSRAATLRFIIGQMNVFDQERKKYRFIQQRNWLYVKTAIEKEV